MDDTMQRRMVDTAQGGDSPNEEILPPGPPWRTRRAPARSPPLSSERVVFSWDISPRWTIETDPARTSEVEVRFYAESPTRTRVELEHRHIDRHGPGWEAISDGVDGPQGWPWYLDRYATLVKEGR
jgi:hypothetical protein